MTQGQPSNTSETGGFVQDPLQCYRQKWQEATRPDLAAYVEVMAESASPRLLVELVKVDLDRRWRSGGGRPIETYLQRWPELCESALAGELLKAEFLARSTYHTPPALAELTDRFPGLCGKSELEALIHQGRVASLRESYCGTGRFFLVRRVGAGGMGEVFAALDRDRHSLVALKTLPTSNPERLYRFKHEFRALAEVVHPRLVPLYELVASGEKWFFTMELIDGVSLLSYLMPRSSSADAETRLLSPPTEVDPGGQAVSSTRLSDHPADFARVHDVFRQLAEGLIALHKAGILHRDIKPSNVLVRPDGRVVILDFGLIAEMGTEETFVNHGHAPGSSSPSPGSPYCTEWSVVGTAAYMSPEQAAGRPLTPATDWYAMGVMLYRILTGRYPFSGPSHHVLTEKQLRDPPPPSTIEPSVPPHLGELCEQLLRRDPVRRPGAEEVLTQLSTDTLPTQRSPRMTAIRDTPFVGRKEQMRELRAAYDEMRKGTTVVTDVSGPSGVGKTRLLRHFLREISSAHDSVVLQGRCYERESVPYKALDLLIDSLCRYLASLSRTEREALMPQDVRALLRLFPVLRGLEIRGMERGRPAGKRRPETQDAQGLRELAMQAFCELLVRIGDRHPLVLWIDDLQWDDADSAFVLSGIIRQPRTARLMLILSFRSEQARRMASLAAIEEALGEKGGRGDACMRRSIQVGPLEPEESEQLARHLLDRLPAVRGEVARTIAQQSRGTPYFIHELAHYVSAQQGPQLSFKTLQQLELQDVLRTRIEQLRPGERRLLEAVSVAGRPVRLITAHNAAGLDPADRQAIVSLCAAHLLQTTGPMLNDEVDVFHDRLRSDVIALLPEEPLRAQHARLAAALDEDRDDPELIATHLHQAGETEKAITYYTTAADRAAEALAFERAARLYRASIDLSGETATGQPSLTRKLAEALANAGHARPAADEFLKVAASAAPAEVLEMRRRAAYHYCASGHIAQGRNEFAAILEEIGMRLPYSPRTAIVSCLWRRALLRLRGLRFRERMEAELSLDELAALDITWSVSVGLTMIDTIHAADYQARNLLLALRAGEPYRLVRALAWQSCHVATAGKPARQQAFRLLDTAESIVSRVENPHAQGLLTVARGIMAFFQGDWVRALARCREGDDVLRERCTGVVWERAVARSFALWSLYFLGNTGELMRRQPELLHEARQRGDLLAEASLTNLSGVLMWLARDRPEEARANLVTAMGPWRGLGFRTQHFTSLASHVQIDLYLGDSLSAFRRLESEWKQLRRSMLLHIEAIRIYMLHLRGRCALAAAGTGAACGPARRLARRCARRLGRESAPWGLALGELIRAGLADRAGNPGDAAALLGIAASHLEEAEMGLYAAAARYRQGELIGGDRGRALRAHAREWMAGQKIADCARMVNLFVPRFDEDPSD